MGRPEPPLPFPEQLKAHLFTQPSPVKIETSRITATDAAPRAHSPEAPGPGPRNKGPALLWGLYYTEHQTGPHSPPTLSCPPAVSLLLEGEEKPGVQDVLLRLPAVVSVKIRNGVCAGSQGQSEVLGRGEDSDRCPGPRRRSGGHHLFQMGEKPPPHPLPPQSTLGEPGSGGGNQPRSSRKGKQTTIKWEVAKGRPRPGHEPARPGCWS